MRVDKQLGFSILELLVVLVIVGLTASFAGPGLWSAYGKASEKHEIQSFSGALQQLRLNAFHEGRMIEFSAVSGGAKNKSDQFPAMAEGWIIEHSTALRLLPTGVTSGGEFYFQSPNNHRWLLILRPLDGRVDIHQL